MHADGDWQAVEGVLSKDMATLRHAVELPNVTSQDCVININDMLKY